VLGEGVRCKSELRDLRKELHGEEGGRGIFMVFGVWRRELFGCLNLPCRSQAAGHRGEGAVQKVGANQEELWNISKAPDKVSSGDSKEDIAP
jgi:hypothetical protein